jgi:hypothetical protein
MGELDRSTMSSRSLLLAGASLAVAAMSTGLFVGCGRPKPPTPRKTVETGVRFTSIRGKVQVKRVGTLAWIDATLALALRKDDLVSTDKTGTAKLRFADGTEFDVRPDSVIAIFEDFHDLLSRQPHVGLSIQSGEATFQTPTQSGDRKIDTPGGRTTPDRDTTGSIQVARDGRAAIRIYQGKGRVDPRAGEQVQLGPSEGVQIDAGGKAGPKLSLPEVPMLTAPPDQSTAYYRDPFQATTALTWRRIAGAKSYRVVVDSGATFASPLVDRRVDERTELELQGLAAGTYCWKVAAIDANGSEGGFASAWCFSLLRAEAGVFRPPQLTLGAIELRGTQLHITGRTEPGVTVTVNGERIPVQPDGSFNEHLALERNATAVSVRATGAGGAVTEQRLPIVVSR